MIAAQQDLWNRHPPELARSRVLRIFQQARLSERIVLAARLVSQHSGHQPNHRVDDQHGRHLATVADEVAGGNLQRLQSLGNPFVKSLVAATQQEESRKPSQLPDESLIQFPPLRSQHHQLTGLVSVGLHRFDAGVNRRAGHQHSRSPSVGSVIDRLVPIRRPIADVPQAHVHQLLLDGQLEQALLQVAVKQLGEQTEYIESHLVLTPPRCDVHLADPSD